MTDAQHGNAGGKTRVFKGVVDAAVRLLPDTVPGASPATTRSITNSTLRDQRRAPRMPELLS